MKVTSSWCRNKPWTNRENGMRMVTFGNTVISKKGIPVIPKSIFNILPVGIFSGWSHMTVAINSHAKCRHKYRLRIVWICCSWVWDPKTKKHSCKGITRNGKNMFEPENSNKQVLPYLLMQIYFVLLFLPICMCTATLVSTLPPSVFVGATRNWTCLKISLLLVP